MLQIKERKQSHLDNTFIYQSEYYSLAWGLEQKGFYVDPKGRTYKYKMPKVWHRYKSNSGKHSWGHETDGTISVTELFENLKNSVEIKPLFSFLRKTNPITQAMIDDLLTSTFEDRGQVQCDAGNTSNSLFVYDSEIDLYRRILLSNDGDYEMVNQSVYTKQIIQDLGIVRRWNGATEMWLYLLILQSVLSLRQICQR